MNDATGSRARLVVLISGSGTNLQALLDASAADDFPAEVVAVGCDRAGVAGLRRADLRGVPTFVVSPKDYPDRQAWDRAIAEAIAQHEPDWVVSAGFMRILGPAALAVAPNRVVNTHPALLPSFPGAHAVRDALAYGVKVTGCTVHLVDAGVDTGPVLAQAAVEVLDDDDEDTLHERIKALEHHLLVEVVARLCRNPIDRNPIEVSGRKVTFS
ncbi:MAG: phosphoribosylglycinamide formyltransferase [Actinomycetes bacterium]